MFEIMKVMGIFINLYKFNFLSFIIIFIYEFLFIFSNTMRYHTILAQINNLSGFSPIFLTLLLKHTSI